jgi:hypothetical protein
MRTDCCGAWAAARLSREGSLSTRSLPQDLLDVDGAIEVFQQWLSMEANTGWMLVLDNVDREWRGAGWRTDTQAYDFEDYLPPADHGNVLITTRLFRLQQPKASLRLGAVDNDIEREILESRVGKELPGMCI